MTLHFMRFDDLKRAGIVRNRVTLKRWMTRAENPFPAPVRLGLNSIAWRVEDIEAWLARCPNANNNHEKEQA